MYLFGLMHVTYLEKREKKYLLNDFANIFRLSLKSCNCPAGNYAIIKSSKNSS
jgi:hypothetical protein